jgi:hypothetical protein
VEERDGYIYKHLLPSVLVFQQLPRCALHPQLRINSMRQLQSPRLWLIVFAVRGGVYEDRLEVERSHLRRVVCRDLHGEQAVGRSVVRVQGRVAAAYNDLWDLVSRSAT